jgi:hypothetical protein
MGHWKKPYPDSEDREFYGRCGRRWLHQSVGGDGLTGAERAQYAEQWRQGEGAKNLRWSDCTCIHTCAEDPPTACSLSGEWHVHPGDPCPVHPDAPGDR